MTQLNLAPYMYFGVDRILISCASRYFFTIADKRYRKGKNHPRHVTGEIIKNYRTLKKEYNTEWKWERWVRDKPCKPTLYIFLEHRLFGLVTFRVLTHAPFVVQVVLNVNRFLKNYCDEHSIAYKLLEGYDNGFEYIGLEREEILSIIQKYVDLYHLKETLIEPILYKVFGNYAETIRYYNFSQIEVHHDQVFESKDYSTDVLEQWIMKNYRFFGDNCTIRVQHGVHRLLYYKNGLQIKGYRKDKGVRFEITLNAKYLKKSKVDRKSIRTLLSVGNNLFKKIAKLTNPVEIKRCIPERKQLRIIRSMIYTEKDVKMLKFFKHHSFVKFKNSDVRSITDLKRYEVQYRFSKFRFMLRRRGKTWYLDVTFGRLICMVLDSVQEQSYYLSLQHQHIKEYVHILLVERKDSACSP